MRTKGHKYKPTSSNYYPNNSFLRASFACLGLPRWHFPRHFLTKILHNIHPIWKRYPISIVQYNCTLFRLEKATRNYADHINHWVADSDHSARELLAPIEYEVYLPCPTCHTKPQIKYIHSKQNQLWNFRDQLYLWYTFYHYIPIYH